MKPSVQIKSCVFLACIVFTSVAGAATSAVGRPIKFYETSAAKILSFAMPGAQCTASSLIACFRLDAFGTGTFRDIEVASVNVSASAERSTLCANPHASALYTFKSQASTGENISTYTIQYRYEIQSAVLDDPLLIDPRTHQPFGGMVTSPPLIATANGIVKGWYSLFTDQDYLGPQQRLVRQQKISSFDCANSTINYSLLVNSYGLSPAVAQRLMSGPMTIRMYVSSYIVAAESGSLSVQLRVLGD